MSKYIIELDYDLQRVVGVGVKQGTVWVKDYDVDDLEELCADYINEHYGQLQDEAYKRGLEEGKKATWELVADASNAEYQKGLNDAWECARKLSWTEKYGGYGERRDEIFGRTDFFDIFDCTPNEAIEKLKAYEKKQDDEINVGDEVDWSGDKFIVTRIFQPHNNAEECDGVDMDGCTYHDVLISGLTKTGRHVDITDMLKGALE